MALIVNRYQRMEKPISEIVEILFVLPVAPNPDYRNRLRIVYLLKGSYRLRFPDLSTLVINAGDIAIIPSYTGESRENVQQQLTDRKHAFVIVFEPNQPYGRNPLAPYIRTHFQTFRHIPMGVNPATHSLISDIRNEISESQPGAEIVINALTRNLVVNLARQCIDETQDSKPPQRSRKLIVNQAIEYLTKRFDQPIKLQDIAAHVNLSEEYLCRLFKAETGMNFSRHLLLSRINHAKELLINSNKSIGKISEAVGFSSPSLFSRRFKAVIGVTPLRYRLKGSQTK